MKYSDYLERRRAARERLEKMIEDLENGLGDLKRRLDDLGTEITSKEIELDRLFKLLEKNNKE